MSSRIYFIVLPGPHFFKVIWVSEVHTSLRAVVSLTPVVGVGMGIKDRSRCAAVALPDQWRGDIVDEVDRARAAAGDDVADTVAVVMR